MSQSDIARFFGQPTGSDSEHNPDAANQARRLIAEIPDTYHGEETLSKEDLVGAVQPVSPAASQSLTSRLPAIGRFQISSAGGPKAADPLNTPTPVTQPQPVVSPTGNPLEQASTARPVTVLPYATSHTPYQPNVTQPAPVAAPINAEQPKMPRRHLIPSKAKPLITGIITFILLFLVFKSPILLSQLGYLTSKPAAQQAQATKTDAQVVPSNPIISIPKINVNAPVVFAQDNVEANIQKDLQSGVVHYANTAQPGEVGNSVIFGHSSNDWWEPGNFKFVFVLLDKLNVGDTYTVDYNSTQYVYQVVQTRVVEPTDLSVLTQTNDPEMTLITCTPPGTSWKRLIVRAKQISPTPAASTGAKTAAASKHADGTLPGNSPSWSEQLAKWWQSVVH